MIIKKEKELCIIIMVIDMNEIGKIIIEKEKELCIIIMEKDMKEDIKMN